MAAEQGAAKAERAKNALEEARRQSEAQESLDQVNAVCGMAWYLTGEPRTGAGDPGIMHSLELCTVPLPKATVGDV